MVKCKKVVWKVSGAAIREQHLQCRCTFHEFFGCFSFLHAVTLVLPVEQLTLCVIHFRCLCTLREMWLSFSVVSYCQLCAIVEHDTDQKEMYWMVISPRDSNCAATWWLESSATWWWGVSVPWWPIWIMQPRCDVTCCLPLVYVTTTLSAANTVKYKTWIK